MGEDTDPNTLSNPNECYATHADIDLAVDFEQDILSGSVTYRVVEREGLAQKTNRFVVDTSGGLVVTRVEVDGRRARFVQRPPHEVFGSALEVHLPKVFHQQCSVKITYSTGPKCSAVQWLPPAQTAGQMHPFMFTQCQAIHGRSLVPIQDTPSVKITYLARVRVPAWSTCLMSALPQEVVSLQDSSKVFTYQQPTPIPSYLIAMAVGDLASRDISERCRIWAEPSVVEAAAFDFSETEDFLTIAEELTCEYKWGRYDVLCLPPSFPYGGMENPCLTFVTPTVLAGDKSLATVVAHEISHSWTGNLITNASWEHFWLNEGWTMWLERKITARIRNDPLYFDFDAQEGCHRLANAVKLFQSRGPEAFALTALVPDLKGISPDDAFCAVPYEKGFSLLYSLEQRVGTPKWMDFFKAYIDQFQFKTITTEEFKDFVIGYFSIDKEAAAAIKDFDWDTWLHTPGMPKDMPHLDDTLCKDVYQLADAWLACDGEACVRPDDPATDTFMGWASAQKVMFLERLLTKTSAKAAAKEGEEGGEGGSPSSSPLPPPLPLTVLRELGECYGLSDTKNSEIRFRWCTLSLRAGDWAVVPNVVDFITTQGRMKFVRPLYRELKNQPETAKVAVDTFLAHASFYHPICRQMVEKDLGVTARVTSAEKKKKKKEAVGLGGVAALWSSGGGDGKGGDGDGGGEDRDWLVTGGIAGGVAAAALVAGAWLLRKR